MSRVWVDPEYLCVDGEVRLDAKKRAALNALRKKWPWLDATGGLFLNDESGNSTSVADTARYLGFEINEADFLSGDEVADAALEKVILADGKLAGGWSYHGSEKWVRAFLKDLLTLCGSKSRVRGTFRITDQHGPSAVMDWTASLGRAGRLSIKWEISEEEDLLEDDDSAEDD